MNIGIIGVGNIGGALAQSLLTQGLAKDNQALAQLDEVWLYDQNHNLAQAKAMDLAHSTSAWRCPGLQGDLQSHTQIRVAGQIELLRDCDVLVITAGKTRDPGMTREDLIHANGLIMQEIMTPLEHFKGLVIVVTNPVDIMAALVAQSLGQTGAQRVLGMAGQLDSARLRCAVAQAIDVKAHRVQGWVVGPHNDHMVPLRQSVQLDGQPYALDDSVWAQVVTQTQQAGATLGRLFGQGSAYYGPALATHDMLCALVAQDPRVIACSAASLWAPQPLHDHYEGLFWGQLVAVGRGQIQPKALTLTAQEQAQLDQGLSGLRGQIQTSGLIDLKTKQG
jgi:malate dehydrogenase